MIKISILIVLCILSFRQVTAQQTDSTATDNTSELVALLESISPDDSIRGKRYTMGTFKTTRIANGHSVENVAAGILDFRINHRFGKINDGIGEFFGLDNAVTRIGFDYGITDWLMTGIGRSTLLKDYDGFVKARIFRQTEDNALPLSLSYLGAISTQKNDIEVPAGATYPFSHRLAFVNQLLIARKFGRSLSLQFMPSHLHYNFVTYHSEPNDLFILGAGGRLKLSHRIALTAEYYYQLPGNKLQGTRNALTLGIDIETGGHVFQLLFSNATGITERTVLGQTTGDWGKGDIHFGFNISRVFTVVKPKGFEDTRNKIW